MALFMRKNNLSKTTTKKVVFPKAFVQFVLKFIKIKKKYCPKVVWRGFGVIEEIEISLKLKSIQKIKNQ